MNDDAGRLSLTRVRAALVVVALLCAGTAGATDPASEFKSVDQDVQSLKKQLIDLNRDLFKLEEELLYPASTQVAVFLSVVASTTALVRHNLPATQWAAGISAFTIVFAAGQIVGPTLVGHVADGEGGLVRGFAWSAAALALGALCAARQRPLAPPQR